MRTWLLKIGLLLLLTFPCAVGSQAALIDGLNMAADAQTIRVIRDPHNGMRWRLERTTVNPGGPGRLVLLNDPEGAPIDSSKILSAQPKTNQAVRPPVIHAGDRLVIEERSVLVEARFEVVSLGAAVQGAEFNARLAIGGNIVRAVALGPGRAAFATGWRVRR